MPRTILGFDGLLESDKTEQDRVYRVCFDQCGLHCHDRASRCHLHIHGLDTHAHYQVPVDVRLPRNMYFPEEAAEGFTHLFEPAEMLLSRRLVIFLNDPSTWLVYTVR